MREVPMCGGQSSIRSLESPGGLVDISETDPVLPPWKTIIHVVPVSSEE